jgi:hypothetical protein
MNRQELRTLLFLQPPAVSVEEMIMLSHVSGMTFPILETLRFLLLHVVSVMERIRIPNVPGFNKHETILFHPPPMLTLLQKPVPLSLKSRHN